MTEGINVSYREGVWVKYFFRILGVVGLMGGLALIAFLPREDNIAGIAVLGVAVFGLIANELHVWRQRTAERYVVDTGSGFRWLGGPVEMEVPDAAVVAVRLKVTSKFSAGLPQGTVRRFEVWTADGNRPMCMKNYLKLGEEDPLAGMIARITEDLKQRTAEGLAKGAVLQGEGWRLHAMQLSVARRRKLETVPMLEIATAGFYDGKLCLWRRGQEAACLRIDPASKNAAVLTALLFEWIEHRQATAGGQDEVFAGSTGMGRLLFERRRREVFVVTLVIALVAGLIGAGLFFSDEVEVVGILLLAAAGVALIVGWLVGRIAFRCYERGLARGNGGGEVRLSFEEIDELTYSAKRMFYKGSYVGTQLVLTFRGAAKKIKYSARIQNEDVDIDAIRDQVAQGIAARMLQQLRSGRPVTWMNDVVLLPEGLQFRRSKLFGLASGPVEVLLYGQIAGVGIAEGSMYLHNVAESQSVLSKPDSSPNFYPGYLALLRLWEVARLAGRQGSANP